MNEKKTSILQPVLLRIRDAAAMLSISERSVWQLVRSGDLPTIHPPGMRAVRIAREDVEKLIARWHNREDLAVSTHE